MFFFFIPEREYLRKAEVQTCLCYKLFRAKSTQKVVDFARNDEWHSFLLEEMFV